jgi:hypothetical protein
MRALLSVGLMVLGLVLGLGGCADQYQTFQPPPLDFSNQPPLRFAVGAIDIQSAYQPHGAPPYVDHTFALTPEAATRQLLEHRLQAAGGPGRLQAVIVDASVTEQKLATESGIRGWLTTQPAARFEGRLKVRIDHLDDAGTVKGSISTTATRTKSLPEDIGYAERQRLGYELVRDLINDLDAGLTANLRETFADLLHP